MDNTNKKRKIEHGAVPTQLPPRIDQYSTPDQCREFVYFWSHQKINRVPTYNEVPNHAEQEYKDRVVAGLVW